MKLEELKKEHGYVQLTDKQKAWVDAYIANDGDYIAATKQAYECKDSQSARALGRQTLQRPEVSALIDKYYGHNNAPTREEFLQRVWKAIQKASSAKDLKELMLLYERLAGWDKEDASQSGGTTNNVLREMFGDKSDGTP